MLDLIIFKDPTFAATGKFATSLYQKAQNKYLYLPPRSFHSPHVFSAFVIAEVKRYRLHCSREEDFFAACAIYRQRLLDRGYNSLQLQSWFATVLTTTSPVIATARGVPIAVPLRGCYRASPNKKSLFRRTKSVKSNNRERKIRIAESVRVGNEVVVEQHTTCTKHVEKTFRDSPIGLTSEDGMTVFSLQITTVYFDNDRSVVD
jgi:hypothetical protein